MPHDREEAGVGRGNGLGSRGTQFGHGQPTNKGGRKKKVRVSPSASMSDAFYRLLSESQPVKVGDRYVELSRFDMLAHKVMENFEKADFKERLALISALAKLPPAAAPSAWEWKPPANVNDILAELAAEYEADWAAEEDFRQQGVVP